MNSICHIVRSSVAKGATDTVACFGDSSPFVNNGAETERFGRYRNHPRQPQPKYGPRWVLWLLLFGFLLSVIETPAQERDRRNRRREDRPTRTEPSRPNNPDNGRATETRERSSSSNRVETAPTNTVVETNASVDPAFSEAAPLSSSGTNRFSLQAFHIIPERNIFNPNRTARSARGDAKPEKVVKVDTVALLGTMEYAKGRFAVFDGSSSAFKKVAPVSDSIAGYTITDIQHNFVKLEKEGKTLQLTVGQQLKREDEGDWSVSAVAGSFKSASSSSSTSPGSSSPSSGGDESDALKRLLQKREQELTK